METREGLDTSSALDKVYWFSFIYLCFLPEVAFVEYFLWLLFTFNIFLCNVFHSKNARRTNSYNIGLITMNGPYSLHHEDKTKTKTFPPPESLLSSSYLLSPFPGCHEKARDNDPFSKSQVKAMSPEVRSRLICRIAMWCAMDGRPTAFCCKWTHVQNACRFLES